MYSLTFDDILLTPQYSEIESRLHTDVSTQVTKRFKIDIPIITANMDTITEETMARKMNDLGGLGVIHRFNDPNDQAKMVHNLISKSSKVVSAAVGVGIKGELRANLLADAGVSILVVDIAHGDSKQVVDMITYIKNKFPHIDVIAGNIATASAARRLMNAGADALKVGIGPGSMCTTRIVTGHGVPQVSAIKNVCDAAIQFDVPVIADGGIRNSGDIVKALAFGASSIMVGSLVAGTTEVPKGLIFRGMASNDAQLDRFGKLKDGTVAEGVSIKVQDKGSVANIINDLVAGIRSGLTYSGARTIKELQESLEYVRITENGRLESGAHGK